MNYPYKENKPKIEGKNEKLIEKPQDLVLGIEKGLSPTL